MVFFKVKIKSDSGIDRDVQTGGTLMFQNTFLRRTAALVLTLALAVSAALPGLAAYPMPIQTASETESVYLFDADTGKTILSQNADQQQYVASLTKLMTALLLLESGKDLNGEVTVPTAQDLAKIAAACAENETFTQIAGTKSYVIPATNLQRAERAISSSNGLMTEGSDCYREYVQWVKGGFTTLAGRCAVAFAQKDGHTYGLVILNCDTLDHLLAECAELFDWAFESFSDRPLVDTQTVLTTIDLTKCRAEPMADLYAAAPVSGYGHADDKVSYSFDLPESIPATVKNGQVVGTATVYLDGYEVGTVELVTHQEYVSDFRTDTKATILLLCALLVILFLLTVLTLAAGGGSLNLRRRKRRR